MYDSVVETIRSYVCFAGWKVQIIVAHSKFETTETVNLAVGWTGLTTVF